MCEEPATAENLRAATPHPVPGSAVDPITLKPVDEVVVTTLVDNVYDALLGGQEGITRAPVAAGIAQAPSALCRPPAPPAPPPGTEPHISTPIL